MITAAKIFCSICVVTLSIIVVGYLAKFLDWIENRHCVVTNHSPVLDFLQGLGYFGIRLLVPCEIFLVVLYFTVKYICLFWNFNFCWFGIF